MDLSQQITSIPQVAPQGLDDGQCRQRGRFGAQDAWTEAHTGEAALVGAFAFSGGQAPLGSDQQGQGRPWRGEAGQGAAGAMIQE